MILPDDLDEKAEIRVGETDTEEEFDEEDYRGGNGEIKLVLREMKQRPKVKRHRSSRRNPNQHHHQHQHHHPHERIQLGNGLQLSLGRRRDEDVFILKQEFKGLQPSSAHNSPRRTPEGSPRKPSPRRQPGCATAADESHHHRPWSIRTSTNNPTGLGLNIWPNHSFFSRASSSSQPVNTNANTNTKRDEQKAEDVTDTAVRIEQPSSDVNSFMESSPRVRNSIIVGDRVEEDKEGSGSDDDRKKHNNSENQSRRTLGGWWWPLWPWHTTNNNRIRGGRAECQQ